MDGSLLLKKKIIVILLLCIRDCNKDKTVRDDEKNWLFHEIYKFSLQCNLCMLQQQQQHKWMRGAEFASSACGAVKKIAVWKDAIFKVCLQFVV